MNGDNILRSVVGHKNSLPHKATFTQDGRLEATRSRQSLTPELSSAQVWETLAQYLKRDD